MSDEKIVKLKIKTAYVEIDFEGSEEFLRSDLLKVVEEAGRPHKGNPPIITSATPSQQHRESRIAETGMSIKSIATKLKVTTGPELTLAACAYLTLSAGRETFSRKDILDTMKDASTFYKRSYSNNFSNYLDSLVRDNKILQQANDMYALKAQARDELEMKLGS